MKEAIIETLRAYEEVRQNLFAFTDRFYDNMGYDINGYWEEVDELDKSDLKELKKKVKNFEKLTKCYSKIDYKYS
jgi:hypothetical protein